jgi:hypothetical protein
MTGWLSSKRIELPCDLYAKKEDKRGLHDVYNLGIRQSAVFMSFMVWILDERGLHDACDSDIGQARSSCCLFFGSQVRRSLHVVCDLVFRQTLSS